MSHPLAQVKTDVPRIGTRPETVSRSEFLSHFGQQYQSGQHVTMLGPTGRGKTTLGFQMLGKVASPKRRATLLAGKPPGRDPVMEKAPKLLRMREVETYPPVWSPRDRKLNGYVLKPVQTLKDLDKDNAELKREFRHGLMSNYADTKHKSITYVDEGHHVQNDLKLKAELEAPLMRGAPDNGVWVNIQRGRYMSYHCYGAPEWIVIFYDPDRDNRRRYSDIGGVDPDYLEQVTGSLRTYTVQDGRTISEALVVRRSGPELLIVDVS